MSDKQEPNVLSFSKSAPNSWTTDMKVNISIHLWTVSKHVLARLARDQLCIQRKRATSFEAEDVNMIRLTFVEYFEEMGECLLATCSHRVSAVCASPPCIVFHSLLSAGSPFFYMTHSVLSVLSKWLISGDPVVPSSSCLPAHEELPFPILCSSLDRYSTYSNARLRFLTAVGFICSQHSCLKREC